MFSFLGWIFCCFQSCQYQAVLITAVSSWPSPPAAHQLAPSKIYLPLHWLAGSIGLLCIGLLVKDRVYIYICFFLVHGPSQGDYGLYSVLLPSFILFISLNKYVNTGIGTCCFPSWCSFIIKYAGCNPASLPNSLMVSGPAQGVYAEGVCELSLWLHHNLNYSTALRNAFHLFDRCHAHGE